MKPRETPPPFTLQVAEALRAAGDDGLTAREIAEKLTDERVPIAKATETVNKCIVRLNRAFGYVISYAPDEGEDRFVMVVDAECRRGVERTAGNQPEVDRQPSHEGGAAGAPSGAPPRKAPVPPGDAGFIPRASADGSLSAASSRRRSGASDDGRPDSPSGTSSGAPPEGQLFPLPAVSPFDVKAEAA